jgi:putative phage replisome organizer
VKNEFSRVCEEIKNNWIEIAHEYKLSGTQLKITEKRKRVINNLLKEYSAEEVLQAMEKVHTSSFLQGNNKTGWQISFDWFINKSNFLKVLEGNYDDKINAETKNNANTNKKFRAGIQSERPKVTAEGLKKYFGGAN